MNYFTRIVTPNIPTITHNPQLYFYFVTVLHLANSTAVIASRLWTSFQSFLFALRVCAAFAAPRQQFSSTIRECKGTDVDWNLFTECITEWYFIISSLAWCCTLGCVQSTCIHMHLHVFSSFHQNRWRPARCGCMYLFFCVSYLLTVRQCWTTISAPKRSASFLLITLKFSSHKNKFMLLIPTKLLFSALNHCP